MHHWRLTLLTHSTISTLRLHSAFREKKRSGRCRYGNSILWLAKYIYVREAVHTSDKYACTHMLPDATWTTGFEFVQASRKWGTKCSSKRRMSLNIPFTRCLSFSTITRCRAILYFSAYSLSSSLSLSLGYETSKAKNHDTQISNYYTTYLFRIRIYC